MYRPRTAAMIGSNGKVARAKKFSFLANKLQAATSNGALSMVNNQETVQGHLNRYVFDLTKTNLNSDNGIEFWSKQMAIYKLIGPFAFDLLSAPASQAFVERISFSVHGLVTAGQTTKKPHGKALQMRAFLKVNKRLFK